MDLILLESSNISLACTSDTHNEIATDHVPNADVFLHAGDMTQHGTFEELQAAYNWIAALPHKIKVVIAGNHDVVLDPNHSSYSEKAHQLFTSITAQRAGIHYLDREVREVARYRAADGSIKPLRVYGNPCQPNFKEKSKYCFLYPPFPDAAAVAAWTTAPIGPEQSDVDIWLMHSPPKGHLDGDSAPPRMGCEVSAQHIAQARPLLTVFGHCHSTYGVERVTWNPVENQVGSSELLSKNTAGRTFDLVGPGMFTKNSNTLFVNAAWMPVHKVTPARNEPWLIKIDFDAGRTRP